MRIRTLAATAGIGALLVLTGCVGGDPLPTLPPEPTSTPIFASEEEALAAAEISYGAYNEMSNIISNEGGAGPDRIAPFVTPERLQDEIESAAFLSENSLRVEGKTVVTKLELQQVSGGSDNVEVVAYVCLDVSGTRVLAADGSDVTPADREDVVALEVTLVGESVRLQVDGSEQWPDSSFCS